MYAHSPYIKGTVYQEWYNIQKKGLQWVLKLKGKGSRDYARPAFVLFPFMKQSLILNEYLREFSKKFEIALMLCSGLGEDDSRKKPEAENKK